MEGLDAKMRAYYDSLEESDIQEESAWGMPGKGVLAPQAEIEKRQQLLAAVEH